MRLALDAARGQIVAHRLGAPCAKRDVVFARAALIGMALDREGVAVIARRSHWACLSSVAIDCGVSSEESDLEEHAVADIDHEVLRAAGRRIAGKTRIGAGHGPACWRRPRVTAPRRRSSRANFAARTNATLDHSGASFIARTGRMTCTRSTRRSLSERSVNLDETLAETA